MAEDRHGEADMTFWEHLDVLRASLLKMLTAMAVCSVVAFVCKDALFDFILAPGCSDFVTFRLLGRIGTWAGAGGMAPFTVKLINTDLAAQFVLHMKAAVFAGLLVASPYAIYLLFRFSNSKARNHPSCGCKLLVRGLLHQIRLAEPCSKCSFQTSHSSSFPKSCSACG